METELTRAISDAQSRIAKCSSKTTLSETVAFTEEDCDKFRFYYLVVVIMMNKNGIFTMNRSEAIFLEFLFKLDWVVTDKEKDFITRH